MRFLPVSLILAAALALPTVGCSAETAADKAFGDKVRAYLLEHPEVIQEAVDRLNANQAAAAAKASKAALVAHREAVERDPRDFVAGNPNGKITVVEYFDYRCTYCKAAAPEIQKLIERNKDVRFVLKEFPILTEVSKTASKAAIGAKAEGKYLPVHFAMLAERNLDEAAIDRILAANGVDPAKARAVGESKEALQQITDTNDLARATGVNGTPAFIIGDTMVAGWDAQQVQAAIEAERKKS